MNSALQIDDTVFRARMNELAGFVGNAGKVVRQEAKQLTKEIIARTPPSGGTSRTGQFTTIDVNAKRQGELAVAKDLKSIFDVIPDRMHAMLAKEGQGTREMAVYLSGSHKKFIVDRDYFGTNKDQMRKFHRSKRSSATGRTPRNKAHRSQELGRNAARDKMVVSQSLYESYRSDVWAMVGQQKGGWGQAAQLLGVRVPAWIMRHSKGSTGYVRSNLESEENPYIVVGNTTPGSVKNLQRIVQSAVANRARFMKRNIERMIKYGPGKGGDYGYASS